MQTAGAYLISNIQRLENEDEEIYHNYAVRSGAAVWKRKCFPRAGQAGRDAYCGLPVRQLSVQHSEGREPSKLRTKIKRD